jgi:two-component sensor histidine kinase
MTEGRMAAAKQARPLSIRARLVLLVVSLIVPALLLMGILLWSLELQAHRTQERQLAATARTLSLVVDGRIGEQVAALQALIVSPRLKEGDWRGFDAQAREALKNSGSWVSVRTPGGRQYVNTSKPLLPSPPPGPTLPMATWSGTRSGAQVSDMIWGQVAGRYIVVVMKPVRLDDGRAIHVSVVTPAASFEDLLARQELPPHWTAAILDGSQRVVAQNHASQRFVGHQASAELRAALAAHPQGMVRSVHIDNRPVIAAFDKLPGYGWTAAVAMPRDEALGPVRQAMILGVILGALLLAAAVVFALRIGRQISRPVETVANAASDWVAGRQASFPTHTGLSETDGLSRAFASALEAVKKRDERQRLLMNELNHRVKNTLATVQAVALHTRSGAATVEDFHAALEGRVIAMSRAHELLTQADWEGAELGELARETLSAFAGSQLTIKGPELRVGPTDALNLALILYELATNAAKHGALSTPAGRVTLAWRQIDGEARIYWGEKGGPPVSPPTRKGFGSRLIGRAMRDLQPSNLSFAVEGVRCEFTVHVQVRD